MATNQTQIRVGQQTEHVEQQKDEEQDRRRSGNGDPDEGDRIAAEGRKFEAAAHGLNPLRVEGYFFRLWM
jgi:hypothetical protein